VTLEKRISGWSMERMRLAAFLRRRRRALRKRANNNGEWKYIELRRFFAYIGQAIDRGTSWAVSEPNDEMLWVNVLRASEGFLLTLWRRGLLVGARADEAFFVRCDRTTMTQSDIDTGRLVVVIGIAVLRPAEFVVIKITKTTARAGEFGRHGLVVESW
jgi:uncharacterized protein